MMINPRLVMERHTEDAIDAAVRPVETKNVDISGTRKQGELFASVQEIRQAFGKPDFQFPKSSRHWKVRFGDSTVATIYDYYESNRHADPNETVKWSIGGSGEDPVEILQILGFDAKTIEMANA